MASVRRGQGALNLDMLSGQSSNDLPLISALFLIYFDIKAGYTIGWRRSTPAVDLEGVVEYKSLPSGLHMVKEDLIYYVHNNHAGLSAFVNAPAAEESRNARMIAVGIMVPLSYGRLGKAWKHAEQLKNMASELVVDTSNTKILEAFWEQHKACDSSRDEETESMFDSISNLNFRSATNDSSAPKGQGRNRSSSVGTTLLPPGQSLSAYHPAWSLPRLLETFGPLIFPIHRAALLRKRILIIAHAPVEEPCNFVYDISLLSNIPFAVSDLLSANAPSQRLRPLFSIGVHDIPLLEENLRASKAAATTPSSENASSGNEQGCGWIACTTDSILAMKSTLYDVLITMPPPHSEKALGKAWPKVESPQGMEMKATQRDLRQYKALRWGLGRHVSDSSSPVSARCASTASQEEPLRMMSSSTSQRDAPGLDVHEMDSIVEPLSWSALAYSGFMWWASAGEQRLHSEEERDSDSALLSGLSPSPSSPQASRKSNIASANAKKGEEQAKVEMGIIAYFHRLTSLMLTTLSDIVDVTDSDDEREEEGLVDAAEDEIGPAVYVCNADMVRMGLDVWSAPDHQFVENVVKEYFGRRANVEGRSVDVCGIRIC